MRKDSSAEENLANGASVLMLNPNSDKSWIACTLDVVWSKGILSLLLPSGNPSSRSSHEGSAMSTPLEMYSKVL